MLRSSARAPSNIALIKYMGKKPGPTANVPENPSLSLTLNGLCSLAEVSLDPEGRSGVRWVAELPKSAPELPGLTAPQLSVDGQARILAHLRSVLAIAPAILGRNGVGAVPLPVGDPCIELRTANTFPQSSGIASSASSFAAVTLAAAGALAESADEFSRALASKPALTADLARLSRAGSGSSCRSFEGPWVMWEGEEARRLDGAALPELKDFVILISSTPKAVSSSQAHARVRGSPLWEGRPERAADRFRRMSDAIRAGALRDVAQLAWAESWEMHSLFHTCQEPFSYWEAGSIDALHFLARFLTGDRPPIVTMDAGPNVHVLVEAARADHWRKLLSERFGASSLLEDRQGAGAEWLGGF